MSCANLVLLLRQPFSAQNHAGHKPNPNLRGPFTEPQTPRERERERETEREKERERERERKRERERERRERERETEGSRIPGQAHSQGVCPHAPKNEQKERQRETERARVSNLYTLKKINLPIVILNFNPLYPRPFVRGL